jgi:hypothetical protein
MCVLSVTKEDHGGPSEEHTILSSNHEDDGTEDWQLKDVGTPTPPILLWYLCIPA